jgi:hypothetical protein
MRFSGPGKPALFAVVIAVTGLLSGAARSLLGDCGPFLDVSDAAFCPFVLELFTIGITTGTTPTTYAPADNVTRLQMAAFLSRTADGVLKRGSRRAAMSQFWTPPGGTGLGLTTLLSPVGGSVCDGADVWALNGNNVSRVRASDGKLLDTWTSATPSPQGIVAATGKIYVAAYGSPAGRVWRIDPTQAAGAVDLVASNLSPAPGGIAFDGARLWVPCRGSTTGDVAIVTPGPAVPFAVTVVASGFTHPLVPVYDGANMWVTDVGPGGGPGVLFKLDGNGAILQTVTVGTEPRYPIFDGNNIWVPNHDSASVTVVRASTGAVLATLTGNGLSGPYVAAFDGERLLVTNFDNSTVSLWKAANLSPIGNISTGSLTKPLGASSDGINFWIGLFGTNQLARF